MELEPAEPIWVTISGRVELRYRHGPLAYYTVYDDHVALTTRAYSQGYRPTLRMANEAVARRYVKAWMAKWGAHAKGDLDSQAHEALMVQQQRDLPPSPLEFPVPKYKHRRSRR